MRRSVDDADENGSVSDAFADQGPDIEPSEPRIVQLDAGEPTTMAVSVRVTENVLRELAFGYANDGIVFDEDAATLVCAACHQALEGWQVAGHVDLGSHKDALDAGDGAVSDGVAVTINGESMLLDCSCLYPRTMFGAGRALYDDTIGCLIAPDITGAVDMRAGHEYTVVEFAVPLPDPEVPVIAKKPPAAMNYFSVVPPKGHSTQTSTPKSNASVSSVLSRFWSSRKQRKPSATRFLRRNRRKSKGDDAS